MKIYVFGNLLLKKDNLPLRILPKLQKVFPQISFQVVDPNENFPPHNEKEIIILDTVIGIAEPKIYNFEDLQEIKKSPVSPHDYDLLMHLLLLKKLKKIDRVKIIGLPQKYNNNNLIKCFELIKKIIST